MAGRLPNEVLAAHRPGRRYRALTHFALEGEPIADGELLPLEFTDDPGNHYILFQLLELGTIVQLPETRAGSKDG